MTLSADALRAALESIEADAIMVDTCLKNSGTDPMAWNDSVLRKLRDALSALASPTQEPQSACWCPECGGDPGQPESPSPAPPEALTPQRNDAQQLAQQMLAWVELMKHPESHRYAVEPHVEHRRGYLEALMDFEDGIKQWIGNAPAVPPEPPPAREEPQVGVTTKSRVNISGGWCRYCASGDRLLKGIFHGINDTLVMCTARPIVITIDPDPDPSAGTQEET